MSASLVGSEMCIRDRSFHQEAALCAPRSCQPAPSSGGISRPRQGLVEAVSYTHLTLPTICSV
eukprot:5960144-Alexandrium_andersonii.AAC.1